MKFYFDLVSFRNLKDEALVSHLSEKQTLTMDDVDQGVVSEEVENIFDLWEIGDKIGELA